MSRLTNELCAAGGLVACCAAAIQVDHLAAGQAAADAMNFFITAVTSLTGLGLTAASIWRRGGASHAPFDDRAMIASLDRIFDYLGEDDAAKESVRAVARAITERRYRGK
jgi:hypothetical protein